jgi:hypothetical protein
MITESAPGERFLAPAAESAAGLVENRPMLAINNWLGYRRVQTEMGLLRPLGG